MSWSFTMWQHTSWKQIVLAILAQNSKRKWRRKIIFKGATFLMHVNMTDEIKGVINSMNKICVFKKKKVWTPSLRDYILDQIYSISWRERLPSENTHQLSGSIACRAPQRWGVERNGNMWIWKPIDHLL